MFAFALNSLWSRNFWCGLENFDKDCTAHRRYPSAPAHNQPAALGENIALMWAAVKVPSNINMT